MEPFVLDKISRKILWELQFDSRQSSQRLGEKIGISTTPCWRRVKYLETQGIIRRYTVEVDREKIGLHVCVLAQVALTRQAQAEGLSFEKAMSDCPQVIECYSTTGASDYVIKIVVADMKAYDAFLQDVVFKLPFVAKFHSNVVLREVKANAALPVA